MRRPLFFWGSWPLEVNPNADVGTKNEKKSIYEPDNQPHGLLQVCSRWLLQVCSRWSLHGAGWVAPVSRYSSSEIARHRFSKLKPMHSPIRSSAGCRYAERRFFFSVGIYRRYREATPVQRNEYCPRIDHGISDEFRP